MTFSTSSTPKVFDILLTRKFKNFMDLIPYWLKISVLNKNLINTFYAKHTCRINFALTKFEYSIIS